MKPEEWYHRIVRWPDENQCNIGYRPDLYFCGDFRAIVATRSPTGTTMVTSYQSRRPRYSRF